MKFSFPRAYRELKENTTTPKRVVIVFIALTLLVFGIIGSLIPLFPGRLIAAPSLILFSIYSPTVYALLKRKSDGHPRVQSWFDRIRNWIIHRLH